MRQKNNPRSVTRFNHLLTGCK